MAKKNKKASAAEVLPSEDVIEEDVFVAADEPEDKGKSSKNAKKDSKKGKKSEDSTASQSQSTKKSKKEKKAEKNQQDSSKKAGSVDTLSEAEDKSGKDPSRREQIFGSPIRNLLILALVSILIGVAFLAQPNFVYTYSGYIIGGLIALVGVIYIIVYFCRKPVSGVYRSEFVLGMIALLAGAYVAVGGLIFSDGDNVTFVMIVRILGILMMADGLLKIQYMLDIARMRYKKWWIVLIVGVVGIGLGVTTAMGIVYDLGDALNISGMYTLGAAFCINGVLDFIAMIVIAIRNRKAGKVEAQGEQAEISEAKQKSRQSSPSPQPELKSVSQPEPAPQADIKSEPDPEPESAPQSVPEPAPQSEQQAFEPDLPDPVLASPAEDE